MGSSLLDIRPAPIPPEPRQPRPRRPSPAARPRATPAPTEDLLDEYKASIESPRGTAPTVSDESDLVDEYADTVKTAPPAPMTMPPAVVTAPEPPAPVQPPIQMPPVVVTPPGVFGRPPAMAPRPQPQPPVALEEAPPGALPGAGGPALRPAPIAPPAAAEATRVGMEPRLFPGDTSFSSRLANMFGGLLFHPEQLVTAPVQSAMTANRAAAESQAAADIGMAGGEPSAVERTVNPREARDAATQLAVTLGIGPGERFLANALARTGLASAVGSRAAGAVAPMIAGAGAGAAFAPQDPLAGAAAGGILGGVGAVARGTRLPSRRITYEGTPESPDVRPRIGQAPEQPPPKPGYTGKLQAAPEVPGPDFTVENSPLLDEYLKTQEKPERKPESPYDTPKVVAARARAAEIPETQAINTPERQQIRASIADRMYGDGAPTKGRNAYILLGPAGAGKTSVAGPLAEKTGSLVLDPDDAKKLLPEYENGVGAGAVHGESGEIRHAVLQRAVANGDNIIIPTLGTRPAALHETLDELERAGYVTHIKLVQVPKEVAAGRAVKRFEEGGHFVEPEYILHSAEQSAETYEALKQRPGLASYEKYDNDVPQGQPPKLLERIERATPAAPAPEAVPGAGARPGRGGRGVGGRGQEGAPRAGSPRAGEAEAVAPRADTRSAPGVSPAISGGQSPPAPDEGLALRQKYRPDLVEEYQASSPESVLEQARAETPPLVVSREEFDRMAVDPQSRLQEIKGRYYVWRDGNNVPLKIADEADRRAPVVQQTIGEEGTGASDQEVHALADAAHKDLNSSYVRQGGPRALRAWAANILGRPYESGSWKMDDVYDAIEGATNRHAAKDLGPATEGAKLHLQEARTMEEMYFAGRLRSAGMLARQQFSTPLPIARAAQIAAGVRPGEKVLEPTAGTGNLVNFLRDTGVHLDVNELEPRRAAVLRWLGLEPTMEDALRLPLNGKRYNVVITNPPYGSASVGGKKYTGFGAAPFNATDIAQRFVAAALNQLVDGGRLVAVMPPNTLTPMGQAFRKWLAKEHTPVAYIESPPGAYHGRGTDIGTVLLVVDKGKVEGARPTVTVRAPSWTNWEHEIAQFRPGMPLARTSGRQEAVDVAPVRQEAKAPTGPKKEAELLSREPSGTIQAEEPEHGPSGESSDHPSPPVARGPRKASGRPGRVAGVGGVRPDERPSQPGDRGEPGRGQPADVVAQAGPRDEGETPSAETPGVVSQVSRGPVESDAERIAGRERELEAANASPVFAPYTLGTLERRSPHPRLVVETRAMAGMPAPPITATAKSELLGRAWGRDGKQGGLSDEQIDAVLRGLTAWDNGHGFLASDDVGVGKTREAAGLVLEAIERGAKRILYTTKNENNVADAMREFRLVASGDENGQFPAEMVFVGDYKRVKAGEESLPMPDRPTIYFAHSYNFKDYAPALAEVKPTVWIADEAHEFKNQFADRGIAWRGLHEQVLNAKGHIAYFTATPAVTLDELGYLYGLKEWPIGGFSDWVDRKLGKKGRESSGAEGERAAERAGADVKEMGDRSEDVANLAEEDKLLVRGKKQFMRSRPDVFQSKVTPAETEQVMRELKGAGKYIARDLWRGGVKFDVHEVDILGESAAAAKQRSLYDQAAELTRDISLAARKFGRMNKKVKTSGLDRALIQSYLKQLLFGMRLPTVLTEAERALKAGDQVVISLHSVTGDADMEEGLSADDAEAPMNERLRSAINRINTEQVEKVGSGDAAEFVELGEIPEAVVARSDLANRLAALPPLVDPIRAIEDKFGAKNVAVITGKRTAKQRKAAMGDFQEGKRKVAVISKAGKVGISLHDVNGRRRRMLVADYEWSADTFKQELGRVDRTGQRSSPHVSLVASNLAGEKKFAATIAARMASLGATSKGSAESTGTDALDQFDVSDGISLDAMRKAVTAMDHQTRKLFTGTKFSELQKVGPEQWEVIPKKTPDTAGMRDFLLELMMFPVRESNQVWKAWAAARDVLRSGEDNEVAAARRTGRGRGSILRRTVLTAPKDPPLSLVELKNEAGEKKGVLQGFVTPYIAEIQEARGSSETGSTRSRRYVHVTTPEGELVSGLELNPSEIRRVKQAFGKGERRTMTPAEAWEDLQAGDDVAIRGAGGERWQLHQRKDGRIQIRGATIAKHRGPLMGVGLVRFETVGNYLYIPGEDAAVTKFLERFPPLVERAEESDVDATGDDGTLGGMKDLHSFADPFTAALSMLRAARKLRAQRLKQQAAAAAKAPKKKRLTKKQRQAALQTGPTAGPTRDALRRLFVPGARSAGAGRMARLKGYELAKMAHENEQAIEWLEAKRDLLDQLPAHSQKGVKDFKGPRWQWMFDMQAGRPIKDAKLALLGLTVRRLLDDATDRVRALGTGKLETYSENYMPQEWADTKGTTSWIKKLLGKRPLEGTKHFLHRKSIPTWEDGIDAGHEPLSDNPLDVVLLRLREMNRYVTWHRIFQHGRKEGLFKFWRAMKRIPDGWGRVEDNMAIVYAPRGEEGELRIRGYYIAPEPVLTIVHNYLKPGLRGNPLYDSYMHVGNILNLVQLGWSGFHAGFVAFDATISTGAVGLQELLTKGQRLRGLGHLGIGAASAATGPLTVLPLLAPTLAYVRGHQVTKAYFHDSLDPALQAIVQGLVHGGGRARMDRFYKAGFAHAFRKSLRDHRWVKAGLELPFAATEMAMRPLLEHIVPRMKLGAFATLWEHELRKLPAGSTQDDVERAAKRVWDSIDNRLGQMTYDNLDWNRFVKDVMMGAIRSVGWNVGDVRELGGAVLDVARTRQRTKAGESAVSPRIAYAVMLATLVAVYGAIYTYLHTGDLPGQEGGEDRDMAFLLKDLYYPRTGERNHEGQPERVTPATYVKDVVGFAKHPLQTAAHKQHPLLTELYDLVWANENFYGDQIRSTEDPWYRQARDVAKEVLGAGTPFTVRNLKEERKRGAGALSQAEGFFGVTAAPRSIIRSPAENLMQDYIRARMPAGGSTPEDREQGQARADLARRVREGELTRSEAIALGREQGTIKTPGQAHAVARRGKEEPFVSKFKLLTAEEAQRVYDAATPEQREKYRLKAYLRLKQARAGIRATGGGP